MLLLLLLQIIGCSLGAPTSEANDLQVAPAGAYTGSLSPVVSPAPSSCLAWAPFPARLALIGPAGCVSLAGPTCVCVCGEGVEINADSWRRLCLPSLASAGLDWP